MYAISYPRSLCPLGCVHRHFFFSTKTQKHTFPVWNKVPFLVLMCKVSGWLAHKKTFKTQFLPAFRRFCRSEAWIQREWIWKGENKIERERESIISSIWQEPINRVTIFRKCHNILERYYFGTRKHIEVGLISSKNERERYVFAHVYYLLRLWLGLSTSKFFLAGKVCYCVFVLKKCLWTPSYATLCATVCS